MQNIRRLFLSIISTSHELYTNYLLRSVSLMENCACGLVSFGNILNEQQRGLYVTSAACRLDSCGLKFV